MPDLFIISLSVPKIYLQHFPQRHVLACPRPTLAKNTKHENSNFCHWVSNIVNILFSNAYRYVYGFRSIGQRKLQLCKKGRSTAHYIIGAGGLAKETLVAQAKQNMLANNVLKNGQALANVTVNFKWSNYLFVYHTVTCVVTADIVEFNR